MSYDGRVAGMGRAQLIAENESMRKALTALVQTVDEMLAGGEPALRLQGEQCTECGLGGEGPVKEALVLARVHLVR